LERNINNHQQSKLRDVPRNRSNHDSSFKPLLNAIYKYQQLHSQDDDDEDVPATTSRTTGSKQDIHQEERVTFQLLLSFPLPEHYILSSLTDW
jgi:hypothetical protein